MCTAGTSADLRVAPFCIPFYHFKKRTTSFLVNDLLNTSALGELREILGDDLLDITTLFAEQVVVEADALQQQVIAQDLTEMAKHAHAMKGSCGNVGANALSVWAAALEKSAKAGDIAAAQSAVQALPALVDDTLAAMRQGGYLRA